MLFDRTSWTSTVAIALGLVLTASAASAATLVKTHKAWSVFSHDESSKKICFAASQPKVTLPKGANRSTVFFYISAWPNEGVKSEVSVRLGYPIKPGSTVRVKIGGKTFNLFAKDDKAFVADATEELKLIDAMRAGSTMSIDGMSARGTKTSDRYSLSGITAALGTLSAACP